jgi:hypothetical protein
MRKVLLIKSHRTHDHEREEGDELSTYEKLKAALEERVEKAENERDRRRAERELAEFVAAGRSSGKR